MRTPMRSTNAWLITIAAGFACASGRGADDASPAAAPALGEETVVVTVRRISERVATFVPRGELVLEAGECRVWPLPREGVRRLNIVYPARAGGKTAITITVDSAGTVLRYVENRGLGPAMARDGTPVDPTAVAPPRTTIQLDYVTGEAILSNNGGGESREFLLASTADVENADWIGDLKSRVGDVLGRCGRGS